MQLVIENRASTILYNILISNGLNKGIMLIPANICPIVPAILHKAKMEFEFYDIEQNNYLPSIDEVVFKLKEKNNISAVLFNHTLGYVDSYEHKFKKIKSAKEDIFIINDCCLGIPKFEVKETIASLTLYSTGYSKYVDIGIGGYAFLNEGVKYNRVYSEYHEKDLDRLVSSFNKSIENNTRFKYVDDNWLDFRKPGFTKKEYFERIENELKNIGKHKSEINSIYLNEIRNQFHLGSNYNNWRFTLNVQNKAFVLEKIFSSGLFASSHYKSLAGLFGAGNGENAKRLHDNTINLFNDFRFDSKKAFMVSEIVNKYAK